MSAQTEDIKDTIILQSRRRENAEKVVTERKEDMDKKFASMEKKVEESEAAQKKAMQAL